MTDQHQTSPTLARWCWGPADIGPFLQMVHASGGNTGVMLSWSFSPMAFISPLFVCLPCGKVLTCSKLYINKWKTSTLCTVTGAARMSVKMWLLFRASALIVILQLEGVCGWGLWGATNVKLTSEFNTSFKCQIWVSAHSVLKGFRCCDALLKGPLFSFYLFCNMCYETFCFISWMWDTVLKYFVLKNKY